MIKSPPGHSLISIYCIVILGLELSVRKSLGNLSCLSHFHRISAFAFLVTFPWDIIFQKLFISTLAACRIIFYCRFPYLYGTQWYLVHNLPWHRAKEELISEKETKYAFSFASECGLLKQQWDVIVLFWLCVSKAGRENFREVRF